MNGAIDNYSEETVLQNESENAELPVEVKENIYAQIDAFYKWQKDLKIALYELRT